MTRSDVITERDLAELYAVALPAGAPVHFAAAAEEEAEARVERAATDGALEILAELLAKVPSAPEKTVHKEDCWRTHASCLALYIEARIWEG